MKSEPSRDLAQLHHICVTHLAELTTKAKTQVSSQDCQIQEVSDSPGKKIVSPARIFSSCLKHV